jgi:hypothetical protein
MPAPSKAEFKAALLAAATNLAIRTDNTKPRQPGVNQAFLKAIMVEGTPTSVPGEVPDAVNDLFDVMAEALNLVWIRWQASQTVFIQPTVLTTLPGTVIATTPTPIPVTGVSGPGSLL